jgi:uncharacterized membrane protein
MDTMSIYMIVATITATVFSLIAIRREALYAKKWGDAVSEFDGSFMAVMQTILIFMITLLAGYLLEQADN